MRNVVADLLALVDAKRASVVLSDLPGIE